MGAYAGYLKGMQMGEGIDTDEEGLSLPDGTRYSWKEVEVTIEIKAHIKLPDSDNDVILNGTCEGPDMARILVALLDATIGEQEPLH
jgi:hypothetical protein